MNFIRFDADVRLVVVVSLRKFTFTLVSLLHGTVSVAAVNPAATTVMSIVLTIVTL